MNHDGPSEGAGATSPSFDDIRSELRVLRGDAEGILALLEEAKERLSRDDALVRLPMVRLMVVGDLHGRLGAAYWVARRFLDEPSLHLVCLGDYVDRGHDQMDTLLTVLLLYLRHPGSVTLLRGNHETERLSSTFGFSREVLAIYPQDIYKACLDLFAELPVAAFRKDGVLCLHGGIPEDVGGLEDLISLPKGDRDPQDERVMDILWNDPEEREGTFEPNFWRGIGMTFGEDATAEFFSKLGLWLMVRSHQCEPMGYRWVHDRRVLTVFSYPNYMHHRNEGAVAFVGKDGKVAIETIDLSVFENLP